MAIMLLIAYTPVMINNYAFSDDWVRINQLLSGNPEWGDWEIRSGRPLYGFFLSISNFFIYSYLDLKYFRICFVIALILFCAMFYYFLKRREIFKDEEYLNLLVPLTICLCPSLYLQGAWFTCFPFIFSLILSLISYSTLFSDRSRFSSIIKSTIILILSFSIYQTSAMSFLIFMALDLLIKKKGSKVCIRKLLISLMVLTIAMASALVMVKFVPSLLGLQVVSRSNLDLNFAGTIVWFFNDAIPFFINSLFLVQCTESQVYVIILLLLLLLIFVFRDNLVKLCLLLFVFLFSFFPQLIVAEKWLSLRSSVVPLSFLIIFILYGISSIRKFQIGKILSFIFCLFILFHTQEIFINHFIKTSQTDYQQLRERVESTDYNCVYIDLTNKNYKIKDFQISDEVGIRSTAVEWAVPGMIRQLGKEPATRDNVLNCFRIPQEKIGLNN